MHYVYASYILFTVIVGLYFGWLFADEKKLDRLRSVIDSDKDTTEN